MSEKNVSIYDKQITFKEVPDEISFSLFIAGCPYHCKGCSWNSFKLNEKEYSISEFECDLSTYLNKCSCVTFLGGEWYPCIEEYLTLCKNRGYKICFYTGVETFELFKEKYPYILEYLDYLKVGHYDENAGPLDKSTTNQRFYVLEDKNIKKEIKFYELD